MQAIAGAAIGGLLGLLLGLSTSPVLAGVLSALIALLGGFLVANKPLASAEIDAVKVTGFSVGCALFVVVGILIRTSGLVSGSDIVDRFRQLKAIGYADEDARRLAVIVPSDQASQLLAKSKAGGLFSSETEQNCADYDPAKIPTLKDLLATFKAAGGEWGEIANRVSNSKQTEPQQLDVLKFFWSSKCLSPGSK